MKKFQVLDTVVIPLMPRASQELSWHWEKPLGLSRCWEELSQWVEVPLELSQQLLEPLEPSECREQAPEFLQWLEEPQCLSRGLRGATGPVLEGWRSRRVRGGVTAAPEAEQDPAAGRAAVAAMAHEDVSYYRGQYKDRLLPLLR